MLDGSLGPGQSRTYEVYAANGSAPASGFDPFAWLAAHGNDLTVAVTGRTGSATGAKPDLLFSLKTAIATTTRREILCDTGRFVRIKTWQKVPQEEHLICEYHVDFWLDEAGQPFGLEFAPVDAQPAYGDEVSRAWEEYSARIYQTLVQGLASKPRQLEAVRNELMRMYAEAAIAGGAVRTRCEETRSCADGQWCVDGLCVPVPFRLVFRGLPAARPEAWGKK